MNIQIVLIVRFAFIPPILFMRENSLVQFSKLLSEFYFQINKNLELAPNHINIEVGA